MVSGARVNKPGHPHPIEVILLWLGGIGFLVLPPVLAFVLPGCWGITHDEASLAALLVAGMSLLLIATQSWLELARKSETEQARWPVAVRLSLCVMAGIAIAITIAVL